MPNNFLALGDMVINLDHVVGVLLVTKVKVGDEGGGVPGVSLLFNNTTDFGASSRGVLEFLDGSPEAVTIREYFRPKLPQKVGFS